MRVAAFVLVCVAILVGCARRAVDATPEGAVRALIERIDQSGEDPSSRSATLDLLGPATRANLESRAARLSLVLGRPVPAHEVLVQGWVFQRYEVKAVNDLGGGRVRITGEHPERDRAELQCVKVGQKWRVELALPEVPKATEAPAVTPPVTP